MSLTRRDIEKIAALARLALTEAETAGYVDSLSNILGLVGELSRANTQDVEAMAHPLPGQRQRLRADVVTGSDEREKFQRNAPQVEAGLYLVPRVLE